MIKSPSEFRHEVRQIIFPQDVKKELQKQRKKQRDQERWQKKIYKRSEVKWNQSNPNDNEKYKITTKNAKKAQKPLALYLKDIAASPDVKIGFIPTEQEQELLVGQILQVRKQNRSYEANLLEELLFKILKYGP